MRVYFDGHAGNFQTFEIDVQVRDPCLTASVTLMYSTSFEALIEFNTQVDTTKDVWFTQDKASATSSTSDDLTVCPCFEFDVFPDNGQTLDTDIFQIIPNTGGCNRQFNIHSVDYTKVGL